MEPTQCFHFNLFFPGKGRMMLDPLSRNPSSAFWQWTKVGTFKKELGVALMQCGNESRSKALALLWWKQLSLTHSNKEHDLWLLPFSASRRKLPVQDQPRPRPSHFFSELHPNLSYIESQSCRMAAIGRDLKARLVPTTSPLTHERCPPTK